MKKIVFTIFLFLVFAGILFLPSCKNGLPYDIRGTWNLSFGSFSITVTFSGEEDSGTMIDTYPACAGTGTYTVADVQVSWTAYYPCGPYNVQFTGTIASENSMSGTLVDLLHPSDTGPWTATR